MLSSFAYMLTLRWGMAETQLTEWNKGYEPDLGVLASEAPL